MSLPGPNSFSVLKACGLILLPLLAYLAARYGRGVRWWRRPATWGLLVLAALTTVNYHRAGVRSHKSQVLGYDVFHYYLGGKYREELGTERLYHCALVADAERKRPRFKRIKRVRDLHTYRVRSRGHFVRQKTQCKSHFTDARWQEFRKDLRYFQGINGRKTWSQIFIDRGTNASPAWHLFGGLAARLVPTQQLHWATRLDVVMLGAALCCVVWAFGLDVGLIALVFLTTCFPTRWPAIGAALFRYDWVAAALVGACLLRRSRPIGAGVAFAYAVAVRIFPLVLLTAVVARAFRRLLADRRLHPADLRLGASFVATLSVLGVLAAIDGGVPAMGEFATKISTHAAPQNVSKQRVGLQIAAAYRGETSRGQTKGYNGLVVKRAMIKGMDVAHKVAVAFFLLLVVLLARRLDDTQVLLLGFAMFPLALQASYYYYVMLLVPIVLHADRRERWPHLAALTSLCLLNAAANYAQAKGATRYLILAPGSIAIVLYAAAVFAGAWLAGRPPVTPEPSLVPVDGPAFPGEGRAAGEPELCAAGTWDVPARSPGEGGREEDEEGA